MNESGIFENTHQALMFAFRYESEQYAQTPFAKMMRGEALGNGAGLVGLDGAAQAAMIMGKVARLSREEAWMLVANYAPRYTQCPCCGGRVMTRDMNDALDALTEYVRPRVDNAPLKLRRQLVAQFFRMAGAAVTIAQECDVNRKTVGKYGRTVKKALQDLQVRAQCSVDDLLRSAGMIMTDEAVQV